MSVMDILIALVPALGLGFQVICMQLIGGKYTNKVMGMAIVTLLVGIGVYFVKQPVLTPVLWLGAALSGIGFCIGIILQVKSFSLVGVSMTMPISVGEQLVGTALVGALCFHEWTTVNQWLLGIGALILIVIGIAMTAYQDALPPGFLTGLRGLRLFPNCLSPRRLGHGLSTGRSHLCCNDYSVFV